MMRKSTIRKIRKNEEKIDLTNQSEHLIYETEKNIKEYGDKLDDKEKTSLTEKVEALKKAKDSGNIDDMKTATESLNSSWSQVASKMYEASKNEEDTSQVKQRQISPRKQKQKGRR
jgi:molecular chaperone DnaK